jgi:hypothetical protein
MCGSILIWWLCVLLAPGQSCVHPMMVCHLLLAAKAAVLVYSGWCDSRTEQLVAAYACMLHQLAYHLPLL